MTDLTKLTEQDSIMLKELGNHIKDYLKRNQDQHTKKQTINRIRKILQTLGQIRYEQWEIVVTFVHNDVEVCANNACAWCGQQNVEPVEPAEHVEPVELFDMDLPEPDAEPEPDNAEPAPDNAEPADTELINSVSTESGASEYSEDDLCPECHLNMEDAETSEIHPMSMTGIGCEKLSDDDDDGSITFKAVQMFVNKLW
jgi:hypothetical protein